MSIVYGASYKKESNDCSFCFVRSLRTQFPDKACLSTVSQGHKFHLIGLSEQYRHPYASLYQYRSTMHNTFYFSSEKTLENSNIPLPPLKTAMDIVLGEVKACINNNRKFPFSVTEFMFIEV